MAGFPLDSFEKNWGQIFNPGQICGVQNPLVGPSNNKNSQMKYLISHVVSRCSI